MRVATLLVLGLCAATAHGARHFAHSAQQDDVTARDLAVCKSMATKFVPELKAGPKGYTLFCPTNDAFLEFASAMGYDGEDPLAELVKGSAPYTALYTQILKFHVVKGVKPAAALKTGALPTLSGAPLQLTKDEDEMELVVPGIDPSSKTVDADNTDYIVSDDLTFEGPYAKSKKEYVVHAVDRVLIPPAAADAARRAYATISKASG